MYNLKLTYNSKCMNNSKSALQGWTPDSFHIVNKRTIWFQADLLGVSVQRPVVAETTALGAAYLVGLAVGFWEDQSAVEANWALQREFNPAMDMGQSSQRYAQWQDAVQRSKAWSK